MSERTEAGISKTLMFQCGAHLHKIQYYLLRFFEGALILELIKLFLLFSVAKSVRVVQKTRHFSFAKYCFVVRDGVVVGISVNIFHNVEQSLSKLTLHLVSNNNFVNIYLLKVLVQYLALGLKPADATKLHILVLVVSRLMCLCPGSKIPLALMQLIRGCKTVLY